MTSTSTDRRAADKLAAYATQSDIRKWIDEDITELKDAQTDFFSRIVPRRPKVLVTIDDVWLYLDICTQIAIYYLWQHRKERRSTKLTNVSKKAIAEIFFYEAAIDSLQPRDDVEKESVKTIKKYCKEIVQARLNNFESLDYMVYELRLEYSFDTIKSSLPKYLKETQSRELFPIREAPEMGMYMPEASENFYSLRLKARMQSDSLGKRNDEEKADANNEEAGDGDGNDNGEGNGGDDEEEHGGNILDNNDNNNNDVETQIREEGEQEERRTSSRRIKAVKRFDGSFTTAIGSKRTSEEQVELQANQIVNRKDAVQIRDRVFDEEGGNDSEGGEDVFLEAEIQKQKQKQKEKRTPRTSRKSRGQENNRSASKEGEAEEGDEEGDATYEPPGSSRKKGKARAVSSQRSELPRAASDDEFEVVIDNEQLEKEKSESESRRQKKQEQKRKKRDSDEYNEEVELTSQGTSSVAKLESITPSQDEKRVQAKKERLKYRYATGGNQHGRKPWSEVETECLLEDLKDLYPQHEQSRRNGTRFAIWREIVQRHGPDGALTNTLANRNNVQLKDKARNHIERLMRKNEVVSEKSWTNLISLSE